MDSCETFERELPKSREGYAITHIRRDIRLPDEISPRYEELVRATWRDYYVFNVRVTAFNGLDAAIHDVKYGLTKHLQEVGERPS